MRVVITGASRGIGAEFVRHFLVRGDEVHAVTRHPDRLRSAHPGEARLRIHALDLESAEGPSLLAEAIGAAEVDLLLNNAGTYLDHGLSFEQLRFTEVRRSFEVNAVLAMRVCQSLLPALSRSRRPRCVNVSSLMGSIADNGSGGAYAYRMSKAALNMFTRSFALDFPKITSVVLHPGWVKTEMGGDGAPVEVADSVAGMAKVIEGLRPEHSGRFFDFEGDSLPW